MNKYIEVLREQIDLFNLFDQVYIFGSTIKGKKCPNDIDILLVYRKYTKKIKDEKQVISLSLMKKFKIDIDILLLSEEELKETKFLEKLNRNYMKIK
ncbi:DUF6932 family protein [Aliarcobacter butzleri]|uniref:DUF6932 family protein n=1 Tax=Aliarcobacter butzleri TaxID=28197 RepID=UPI003AF6307B